MARNTRGPYGISGASAYELNALFREKTASGNLDERGYSPMGAIARTLDADKVREGLAKGLDPNEPSIGYFAGRAGIVTRTPVEFAFNDATYRAFEEPSSRDPIQPGHHFDAAIALIKGGAKPGYNVIQSALSCIAGYGRDPNEAKQKHIGNLAEMIVASINSGAIDPNSKFKIYRMGMPVQVPLTKLPSEKFPTIIRETATQAINDRAQTQDATLEIGAPT